jgi:hypothetical protein
LLFEIRFNIAAKRVHKKTFYFSKNPLKGLIIVTGFLVMQFITGTNRYQTYFIALRDKVVRG